MTTPPIATPNRHNYGTRLPGLGAQFLPRLVLCRGLPGSLGRPALKSWHLMKSPFLEKDAAGELALWCVSLTVDLGWKHRLTWTPADSSGRSRSGRGGELRLSGANKI